jgi:hypothetical protein
MHVAQADFKSLRFLNPGAFQGGGRDLDSSTSYMYYNGPSIMTQRVAKTTAAQGSILAIPAPGLNASYEVAFQGPYLKCQDMPSTFKAEVQKSIIMNYANKSHCADYYNFLSWTSSRGHVDGNISVNQPLPFDSYSPYQMNLGSLGPRSYRPGQENNDTATIYFAVMPRMHHEGTAQCPAQTSVQGFNDAFDMFANSTFLQCQLHNTTYNAKFNFTNGDQTVGLDFPNLDASIPVAARDIAYINYGIHKNIRDDNYTTDGCETVGEGFYSYKDCKIDVSTLERLSFQAVMDSFGSLMVGGVRSGDGFEVTTMVTATSLMTTSLMSSRELQFMSGAASWLNNTVYTPYKATQNFATILPRDAPSTNVSLSQRLEELFQNITVSMMSAEPLQ